MAFSSLFIAATGVTAQSQGMQTVSNNLANVSTTGYKHADTLFQSLISQQMATGSNRAGDSAVQASQKGMGVAVGQVKTSFRQGGLETTNTSTDMGISGNGFFGVADQESGDIFYTRDGTFRFDQEGYLRDSRGLYVQGAVIDRETGAAGGLGAMQLPFEEYTTPTGETYQGVVSDPRATESIRLSTNLDFSSQDQVSNESNPFFAMALNWNPDNDNPAGSAGYTHALDVFDENGGRHTLTYYFDEVDSADVSNAAPGYSYWEYVIGMNPEEDARSATMDTSSAGLLSFGTLVFNDDGLLLNQTAYTLDESGDPGVLSNWGLAGFDDQGRTSFDVTFDGGQPQTIGYNMGLLNSNATWEGGAQTAGGVGIDARNLAEMSTPARDVYGTTNYNTGSVTLISTQDGYGQGFLQALNVDTDGRIVGSFSNGQEEALFQVGVYRFNSEHGLRRAGSNLFQETDRSGAAIEGFANVDGRGSVYGSSLEMSNVDMADQFVQMIMLQRGFQANTKVVTTSDAILQSALSIKR